MHKFVPKMRWKASAQGRGLHWKGDCAERAHDRGEASVGMSSRTASLLAKPSPKSGSITSSVPTKHRTPTGLVQSKSKTNAVSKQSM